MNFTQFSTATLHLIHADIAGLIGACELPSPLHDATLYAMTNGGKRVRPLLVAATFLTLHPSLRHSLATTHPHDYYLPSSVRRAMIAVECLHGYSLVHDDLPCMDDDELRRGRPTTHIAYDEATALLVGDVLQTLSFEALSHIYFGYDDFTQQMILNEPADPSDSDMPLLGIVTHAQTGESIANLPIEGEAEQVNLELDASRQQYLNPPPFTLDSAKLNPAQTAIEPAVPADKTPALLAIFAPAARRMVMGQMLDLNGESEQLTQEELEAIHRDKTGALIEASILMGAECGSANPEQIQALQTFANNIGLAFQVQDDILDVTATTEELGKPSGSDEKLDKSTYVKLLGVEQATTYADTLFNTATTALVEQFGEDNLLMDLTHWLWARQK